MFYPQVPIYRVTAYFYTIDIEEIASRYILKVFFVAIIWYLMPQTRSILA